MSAIFARRTVSTATSSSFIRALSTTSACRDVARSPGLGDITATGAEEFNRKQKEFRSGLEMQRKKKEQADSQLLAASHTDPFDTSAPSSDSITPGSSATASNLFETMNLGSLSVQNTGEARQAETDTTTKKMGKLGSIVWGTKEGQAYDRDIERSFSQVLARGKYVHSIVFHDVKPDKVDEYVQLVGNWYPKVANNPENKVNLVGSWRTEVGDCDTFVHIWEYQRYHGYHGSLHQIHNTPEFAEFDKKVKTLITKKHTSLMQEFSFWPTTPPRKLGGLFELRSYTLHPGNLLEWETHWRKGLKARREVMEGVGAWFVQIGDLNTVHMIWQFSDLEERKLRREMSWGVEGWGDTVHKTVPLIQTMQSRILIPMSWSPVG